MKTHKLLTLLIGVVVLAAVLMWPGKPQIPPNPNQKQNQAATTTTTALQNATHK